MGVTVPAFSGSPRKNLLSKGRFTPVEVQWTENPSPEVPHSVVRFLADHPKKADRGFVICRCRRLTQPHERVTALPRFDLKRWDKV